MARAELCSKQQLISLGARGTPQLGAPLLSKNEGNVHGKRHVDIRQGMTAKPAKRPAERKISAAAAKKIAKVC